jgi:hypothetical protein
MWRAASRPSAVCVGGHPDVDHYQRRRFLVNQGQQLAAVPGLPDDLKSRALEEAGQALTKQNVVLGQDHPQPAHVLAITIPTRANCESSYDIVCTRLSAMGTLQPSCQCAVAIGRLHRSWQCAAG